MLAATIAICPFLTPPASGAGRNEEAPAPPGVVKSLNGLSGDVTLRAGTNIILSPGENGLTISAVPATSVPPNHWSLGGNVAAPGSFLGTLNEQPLELKVNGQRALRLEPATADGGPNIVGGSSSNWTGHGVFSATISGGSHNGIATNSSLSTIAGGVLNTIRPGCWRSTIGGGVGNSIEAEIPYGGSDSTIAGGLDNSILSYGSVVGGGVFHSIRSGYSTVAGGWRNRVGTNAALSAVGGGFLNLATGPYATVPGGDRNEAVRSGFAAGTRAKARHAGAFVWGDATDADVPSVADNSFVARASGGVVFYSSADLTAGVQLPAGSGSWATLSDRAAKENVQPVDTRAVLEKLCAVPLATWNYRSQDQAVRHLGPMAQDFQAAFGLGDDDKRIATVDADGVALAAIQGLNGILKEKQAEIESLKCRLERLEKLLEARLPATDASVR